jgi:hypothetical protein
MVKTCAVCGTDKDDDCFITGNVCYKCVYKDKLDKTPKKIPRCRVCNKRCPDGRRLYCSDDCCAVSKKEKDQSSWYKKISVPKIYW